MIYTSKEYQHSFYPNKSLRTVQRMISRGMIPSNHIIHQGKDFMVFIGTEHQYKAEEYFNACVDYHRQKKDLPPYELAASLVCTYNLSMTKFCKMVGL